MQDALLVIIFTTHDVASFLYIPVILSILIRTRNNTNNSTSHEFVLILIKENFVSKKLPRISFDAKIILYKSIEYQQKIVVLLKVRGL
jgi:hypothetical protein